MSDEAGVKGSFDDSYSALAGELRDWLLASLRDAAGAEKMAIVELARRSKVGRATIHAILKGDREAGQETINALAGTLGVPAPTLTLRTVDDPTAEGTPLALVRSAENLLRRAGEILLATSPAIGDADAANELPHQRVERRHRRVQADKATTVPQRPPTPPKKAQG